MIARFTHWQGRKPESIAADASYGNGEFLQWLMDRQITPYMPTRDAVGRTRSPFHGPDAFTYLPKSNSYICPAGQHLNYGIHSKGNRTFGYIGTRKKCGPCRQRSQCTTGLFRYLAIHMNETARRRVRDLSSTEEFKYAQRQRKKVEALFAELKSHSHIGLNRLRLRRLKFVREHFFLAATGQNIERLVRFLSRPPMSLVPATSWGQPQSRQTQLQRSFPNPRKRHGLFQHPRLKPPIEPDASADALFEPVTGYYLAQAPGSKSTFRTLLSRLGAR